MVWIVILGVIVLLGALYILFPIVEVSGNSMYPTYKDGEFLLASRLYKLKVGDVVVFMPPSTSHSEVEFVIKRVCEIKDSKLFFMGDNRDDSYDSRDYGYVDRSRLIAKVINQRARGGGEMMEVIIYTTDCPRCVILESKLRDKGVDFKRVTDIDVMQSKGIMSAPVLEVDGKMMSFAEAVKYVNELE